MNEHEQGEILQALQTRRAVAFRDWTDRMGEVGEGRADVRYLAVRECGGCRLCCSAPAITPDNILPSELPWFPPKPAGTACRHECAAGCARYRQRPDICQGYQCMWLHGLTDDRPDSTGVCWTIQPDEAWMMPMAMGHCHDIAAVLADPRNVADILWLSSWPQPYKLSAVALRSPAGFASFCAMGLRPHVAADVDPDDPMRFALLEDSLRRIDFPSLSNPTENQTPQ